jgi:hypothetical protein
MLFPMDRFGELKDEIDKRLRVDIFLKRGKERGKMRRSGRMGIEEIDRMGLKDGR